MEDQRSASRGHPALPRRSAHPQAGPRWLALLAVLLALGLAAPARATITVDSTNSSTMSPYTINYSATDNFVVNSGGVLDIVTGGSVRVASGHAVTVNGGTVNISGGSVSSSNTSGVYLGAGTVTISGGTVSGYDSGVDVDGGTLNIMSDGSVSGGSDPVFDAGVFMHGGTANIFGGTVSGASGVYLQGGTANISGGSVSGPINAGVYLDGGGRANISGGSVSGNGQGVQVNGGAANISGGSVSANGYGVHVGVSTATATISGGSVSGSRGVGVTAGTATLSGGSVSGSQYGIFINGGGLTVQGCDLALTNGQLTGVLHDGSLISTSVYGQPALQNSSVPPPKITAPPAVSVTTVDGQCSASNVALGTPTLSNICGSAMVTNDAPASFPIGTTTVTWTVTDTSGNQGTATQKVTVTENVPPTISTPSDLSVTTAGGQCTASVSLVTPNASDNCGVASVTGSRSDGKALTDPFPLGTTTVTWTATDTSGNTATATQKVTVTENVPPTISPPQDVTVSTDAGKCSATVSATTLGTPVTSDNCGVKSVTNDAPTTFPLGTTTVTWTVTDTSGNTATATQKVTVTDTQKPRISTPSNLSVSADTGKCTAAVALVTPSASDNCGVASVTGSRSDGKALTDPFPLGTTTVTWTATDSSGNQATATQKVTVTDTQPPTISPLSDLSVSADAGKCTASVSLVTPNASDNCGVASVTGSRSDGKALTDPFPVGTTTVTWTATDTSGNQATAAQKVIVADTQPPTISTPSDLSVNTDAGKCTASVSLVTPNTSDNCPGQSVTGSRSDGKALTDPFPVGTTTVTWTVTDTSGNQATATQKVTVTDTQNPTIAAPADVAVSTDAGKCTASVSLVTPNTSDNCGVASVTGTRSDGKALTDPFPLGTTTVTWTATDTSGNQATATQKVTVTDAQPPTISPLSDLSASADAGKCTASNVALVTPNASDNCGAATVTGSRSDGKALTDPFPVGTTTVTWTATDTSGNQATATQKVTVADTQNPTISAPSDLSVSADAGKCSASNVSLGTPNTGDNCGVQSVTNNAPTTFPLGTTTVTWTVTDTSGNQATATQKVTVTDSQPPAISAPKDVTVSTDAGQCSASNVSLGTPNTGDNCGVQSVTNNAPTTFPLGTTTVTWTVTDTSGLTATATQSVTVKDTTPPTTTASLAGTAGANGWYTGPVTVTLSAADVPACSAVAQTFYRIDAGPYTAYSGPFTVSGDGQHTVSFYSTDSSGNSETPKNVAVNIDSTAPGLTFGAPSPAPNAAGWNNTNVSIPFTATDATSGVASTNPASSPLVLSTEGSSVSGTVSATDVAGNSASSASPAVKIDKTPPTTTASASGPAGANGWYIGNVSVTLTATDTLSGVARTTYSVDGGAPLPYSGPITIKGDGRHTVQFASTDVAGNVETTRSLTVNIDTSKPTLTFGTPAPAPNPAGWNNTPVSIPFTAADATSGVASTSPSASPLVLSTQGKSVTGTVTVTDVAGNMAKFTSPAVNIDLTPPTITSTQSPKPNANGWNNTAVTITFTASDTLSGLVGSGTKSVTLSQQGAGQVASASFQDVAGNTATGTASANIDLTPPTISCPANITTTHLPGKTYATVNPGQATATDSLSGVASIVGVRSDGKQLTANYPIGKTTITWTATDKAGNSSSCTQTITVN